MPVYNRPLFPCVIFFVLGLLLVHDLYHFFPGLAWAAGGAVTAGCWWMAWRWRDWAPVLLWAVMLTGALIMTGKEAEHRGALDLTEKLEGDGYHLLRGRVRSFTETYDADRFRVVLEDVSVTSGPFTAVMPGRVQVSVKPDQVEGGRLPVSGEWIGFAGRLAEPSGLQNFFGYDRLEALRHSGIYTMAIPMPVTGVVRIEGSLRGGWWARVERWLGETRRRVTDNLKEQMWEQEGRLMAAMLFNDMRTMTEAERQVFRESGTFHLFAVSGMHVAILGFMLHLVFRTLRMGVRASWVAVTVTLFFYLWLIDFVPSATRSYVMLLAFTSGYLLGREVDGFTSLVFAVAVVLLWEPASLWMAGFILSVMGVAAIVLFVPLFQMWFPWPHKMRRQRAGWWVWGAEQMMTAVWVTVAVSLVMFPVQVYFFGFYNALSPVANLLQGALSSLVLSAGVMVALVGLVSDSLATLVGHSASLLMLVIYRISEWAAGADFLMFYFFRVPLWVVIAGYAILFGGYFMSFYDVPEFRLKSRARFVLHWVAVVVLVAGMNWWNTRSRGRLDLWFFDVGQGDATLVRFPNGRTMLIDGGIPEPDMGRLVVVPQLRGLGIRMLDFVVATHDDADHTGGLPSVLEEIGAKNLLVPYGFSLGLDTSKRLLGTAQARHSVVSELGDGHVATADGCVIRTWNPQKSNAEDVSSNDRSLVMELSYGDFTCWLMGDAGAAVESRLVNEGRVGPSDVLKVGHHGSASGSGAEFVRALNPKVAVISCGRNNRFGHPAAQVLSELEHTGAAVRRTDVQGAVWISTDGYGMEVRTVR